MIPRFAHRSAIVTALCVASTLLPSVASAQSPAFKDLPATHPAYEAVMFLREQGVISGFPDGTFKPEAAVTRSQAAKIIIVPLTKPEQLAAITQTVYSDIPAADWSIPFVEAMRLAGIVDGPPKTSVFNGGRGVTKSEFLKMLLLANRVDVATYNGDITLPLATDVKTVTEWYYPYTRASLVLSMDVVSPEGTLEPAKPMSRAEVCLMLYRLLMFQSERRTQALLSVAETEIVNTLQMLQKGDIEQAEYASVRALLASRGALEKRPADPLVQAAGKITQSFRALVRAYRAGVNSDYDTAIKLSGEAWSLAGEAGRLQSDMASVVAQVQSIAKTVADNARELKAAPPAPK